MMLLFAYGDLLERSKSYDAEFDAYCEANAICATPFDEDAFVRSMDEMVSVFRAAEIAQLPRARPTHDAPPFIVGMMRSGTSLVEQMLSCHPQVAAGGKLQSIPRLAANLNNKQSSTDRYPTVLRSLSSARMQELADDVAHDVRKLDPGASLITDKLPVNYLHLGLVLLMFPGPSIIHCRRHPLDTCVSCFATNLGASHRYVNGLHSLGVAYQQYVRLMRLWRKVTDLKIIDVRYEEVVADPESQVRRILEHLGLPWDPACLDFHKSRRVQRSASMDQVRQPIYTSSLRRYTGFESRISILKSELADLVDDYEAEVERGN